MSVLKKAEDYLISIKQQGEEFIPYEGRLIDIPNYNTTQIVNNNQKSIMAKKIQEEPAKTFVSNGSTIDANWKNVDSMEELNQCIKNCKECELGLTRKNFVFGEGNFNADIFIIGEAPGRDEDEQGRPFIGRAGKLLTQIIEAIGFKREDVFIANICKCRPPENRRPKPEETNTCKPYLMKQIELVNPKFVIALGLTSIDTLMDKKHKMGDIRGNITDYNGRKLMVTYHPAALLRNPNWKRPVWEDMKNLKNLYDQSIKENR